MYSGRVLALPPFPGRRRGVGRCWVGAAPADGRGSSSGLSAGPLRVRSPWSDWIWWHCAAPPPVSSQCPPSVYSQGPQCRVSCRDKAGCVLLHRGGTLFAFWLSSLLATPSLPSSRLTIISADLPCSAHCQSVWGGSMQYKGTCWGPMAQLACCWPPGVCLRGPCPWGHVPPSPNSQITLGEIMEW